MANKYRKVTISLSSDELNALEDLLFTVNSKVAEKKLLKKLKPVYTRMARDLEKKSNTSNLKKILSAIHRIDARPITISEYISKSDLNSSK